MQTLQIGPVSNVLYADLIRFNRKLVTSQYNLIFFQELVYPNVHLAVFLISKEFAGHAMLHVKPVLVLAWIAVLPARQRIFVYLILPYVYNNAQKDTLKVR